MLPSLYFNDLFFCDFNFYFYKTIEIKYFPVTNLIRFSLIIFKSFVIIRRYIELESGGYIIDSPGLREVQLWVEDEALDNTFTDISEIAQYCKFTDCRHEGEPGCAVQSELEKGNISPERYDSYLHLKKELAFLNRRKAQKNRQYQKDFSKMVKQVKILKEK